MKTASMDNRFVRVEALYLLAGDPTATSIGVQTLSMLVPWPCSPDIVEASMVSQTKALVAAKNDVIEDCVCIVALTELSL
jgi:hypothetical protein